METLWQDLKFGWRVLRKSPGFAAMAILVLALGIGANTAIFSVVNTVLLRPLPLVEPDRLVHVWHTPPQASFPGISIFSVSPANFLDWRSQNHVFEGLATSRYSRYTLTGTGRPEALWAVAVSEDYFPIMRVQPLLGRLFLESENQPGHDHVVVLSHEFWHTRYNASPDIVGKTIQLNNEAFTVVGVMPANFGPAVLSNPEFRPKMWKPLAWSAVDRAVRANHNYTPIARLKPGVTLEQAQAEMNTISTRLAQQYPADDKGWGATVIPLRQDMVGDVRPALLVLLGAVAFVLLIACANVANLVLAKTLSRKKEVAIRTALGASRRRVLQQVLAETVLMALIGGALGLVLAHYGDRPDREGIGTEFAARHRSRPGWLGARLYAGDIASDRTGCRLTACVEADNRKRQSRVATRAWANGLRLERQPYPQHPSRSRGGSLVDASRRSRTNDSELVGLEPRESGLRPQPHRDHVDHDSRDQVFGSGAANRLFRPSSGSRAHVARRRLCRSRR